MTYTYVCWLAPIIGSINVEFEKKVKYKSYSITGNNFPFVPILSGWMLPSSFPSGLWTSTLMGSHSPASAVPSFLALLCSFHICTLTSVFLTVRTFLGERHCSKTFLFEFLVTIFVAEILSMKLVIFLQLSYALLSFTFSHQHVICLLTKQYFVLRALKDTSLE